MSESRIRWSASTRKMFNLMCRNFSQASQVPLEQTKLQFYDMVDSIERQKKNRPITDRFSEARVKRG